MKAASPLDNSERVLLVGVALKRASRAGVISSGAAGRESLVELEELVHSAGAKVVGSRLQMRDTLDSATLVGSGMLAELKREAERLDAGLIVLDRRIDDAMPVDPIVARTLNVPLANGRELAMIYACGRVLRSEVKDGHICLDAELPESLAVRLDNFGEASESRRRAN